MNRALGRAAILGKHFLATATPLPYRRGIMTKAPSLIPLDNVDPALVEQLLDRAFEPERRGRTAYKVRGDVDFLPALSFAAVDEAEHVVGTIQCWPVALTDENGRRHPMIMVGPVAVLPEAQGRGFGKALVTATIAALNPQAALPLVMIGDADYYGRFWEFSNVPTAGWDLPGPFEQARLLVRSDNHAILPKSGMLGPWV
jgi:predicted N-acetyltransferase YhbS